MKGIKILLVFLLIFFVSLADAQQVKVDSLYKEYLKTVDDTAKVNLLTDIYKAYSKFNEVKGLGYAREALELSERKHFDRGICIANTQIGDYFYDQLNYSEALKHYLKATIAGENQKMFVELSVIYNKIGIIYSNQKKNTVSLKYFFASVYLPKSL